MCRNQAEPITNDNGAKGKHSKDDSMPAHSEAKEAGKRVRLGDRAVEIKERQIHPVTSHP